MADRGFNIDKTYGPFVANLQIPAFIKGENQCFGC